MGNIHSYWLSIIKYQYRNCSLYCLRHRDPRPPGAGRDTYGLECLIAIDRSVAYHGNQRTESHVSQEEKESLHAQGSAPTPLDSRAVCTIVFLCRLDKSHSDTTSVLIFFLGMCSKNPRQEASTIYTRQLDIYYFVPYVRDHISVKTRVPSGKGRLFRRK